MSHATHKSYRRGTHRTISPGETMERFGAHAGALGITRMADVTGLDYIGIPVIVAVRPNGRSLSISQGKGLDRASATASAFMEAVEFAHAEQIVIPRIRRSSKAMRSEGPIAEPRHLPRWKNTAWSDVSEIEWLKGINLADNSDVFVPSDLVDIDYTQRSVGTALWRSSDGLGAGNHRLEAICAGACELIERDATALWSLRDRRERAARRVRLKGIENKDARALLDRYLTRGISVSVWDATTDLGIACFICRVREDVDNEEATLGEFWGAGCHLHRDVALIRALTEAAQSRLTYITGVRDDLERGLYTRPRASRVLDEIFDQLEQSEPGRQYRDVPSTESSSFEQDVETLLARLRAVGLKQVIAIDLTDDRIGIPVVKIVVPGLEAYDDQGRLKRGPRARAFVRSRQ